MNAAQIQSQQASHIVYITFWSQFAVFALHSILILYLTRPIILNGLGYSHALAYTFIGVSQATGYLMPMLGGFMADNVIGVRRSILIGSILLACAYLLVMLSGLTVNTLGDSLFLTAYSLVPAASSLLMGTSATLVSRVYREDAVRAKSAMTYYYIAINVGAMLATLVAPGLFNSRYGPLSVLLVTFVGKAIAAINFIRHYKLYDAVVWGADQQVLSRQKKQKILLYLLSIYAFTLYAYTHTHIASMLITSTCLLGIIWFFYITLKLAPQSRNKQLIALFLILEAIIFFVIHNQINTTLIIFAAESSDLKILSFGVAAAQFQLINPLIIILLGMQLPKFYARFPSFTIPHQFASGTVLAGFALMIMAIGAKYAHNGIVSGNYLAVTYACITLAELWVSAIGLSMIGLYCEQRNLSLAMGVWYLASSLSNTLSGYLAAHVASTDAISNPLAKLALYQMYYWRLGLVGLILGAIMMLLAPKLSTRLKA